MNPKTENGRVAKCNTPLKICRDSFCPCIFYSDYTRKGLQDRSLAGNSPLLSALPTFPPIIGGIDLSHYPCQEIAILLHMNAFCNSSIFLWVKNYVNGSAL